MERIAVESKTGMVAIQYDAGRNVLEIEFKSRKSDEANTKYQYSQFTQEDYDAFLAAESKGSHFIKHIKPRFTCRKVELAKKEETCNS